MNSRKYLLYFLIFAVIFTNLPGSSLADDGFVYTVKKGDNLTEIASDYEVEIEKIVNLNDIKNPDMLYPGQKLYIPVAGQKYTIKRGDTLREIANKFNIDINRLIDVNQIKNPDKIICGQTLKIPESEQMVAASVRSTGNNLSRRNEFSCIWPVQGRLSSRFGWRIHPIKNKREYHSGIDIGVQMGSPVYAAESGKIITCEYHNGYGKLVIIKHRDNMKTYYGHNLKFIAREGEWVKKGKIIALSGNSGLSTGPHLHFEIRRNDQPLNPMKFLNNDYLRNGFDI